MRILYFELYCIPCHWAVVSVLSDCLFYDILLIFVSFSTFHCLTLDLVDYYKYQLK